MDISFFNQAQNVWSSIMRNSDYPMQIDLQLHKKMLDLFHVGSYYYYFVDWQKLQLIYVSPEIETILGYPSETVDATTLISLIHPDDQHIYLNHEAAVVDFIRQLPTEKVLKYKMSYDFRVRTSKGDYVRILQQAIALQCDDNNNLLLTLGVHTDISHLKKSTKSVLSFLGLDGEPSYIDVNVKSVYKPSKEIFTKREKEIINCIINGDLSNEIAKKLFISKHTVDSHRKNILSKTHTKNTLELAIKVINEGLL